MAIGVRNNTQVTVRHRVGDLAGVGTVSGIVLADFVAAGLVLRDPTTGISAVVVAVGEIGTTGYYDFTFTPDLVGLWELTVVNPASPPAPAETDEATVAHWVQSSAAAAIGGVSARDLTTRDRVRSRLQTPDDEFDFDDLFDQLITEVSNWIQDDLGRDVPENAFVEYFDGNDQADLFLSQGPLVSVDTVESVLWEDDGSDGMQETRTTLEAFRYVQDGTVADLSLMKGMLRRADGGLWETGQPRRWRVVYVAGHNPLPDGIVHLATTWVVHEFLNRETRWNQSKGFDDITVNLLSPAQMQREKDRILAPYRDDSGEW